VGKDDALKDIFFAVKHVTMLDTVCLDAAVWAPKPIVAGGSGSVVRTDSGQS
jgi:hypothetical protein